MRFKPGITSYEYEVRSPTGNVWKFESEDEAMGYATVRAAQNPSCMYRVVPVKITRQEAIPSNHKLV